MEPKEDETGTGFTLQLGEQYFLALLHELKHFKKERPPREFIKIKEKLENLFPDDKETQLYAAERWLKPRKGESEGDHEVRLMKLRSWMISGRLDAGEMEAFVDAWAIDEFAKSRERIRGLLN